MPETSDPEFDPEDTLIAPLSQMLDSVGKSIVEASTQLERAQLENYQNYPDELKKVGITPAFYHMQEVEVELKLALHITGSGETTTTEYGKRSWLGLGAAPVNAEYTETRNFDVNGSSRLTMTFAPAPPPTGLTPADDPEEDR